MYNKPIKDFIYCKMCYLFTLVSPSVCRNNKICWDVLSITSLWHKQSLNIIFQILRHSLSAPYKEAMQVFTAYQWQSMNKFWRSSLNICKSLNNISRWAEPLHISMYRKKNLTNKNWNYWISGYHSKKLLRLTGT
jgi:hypothetical protein